MENKFQSIPGFSKYETNGKFIRNAKTKFTITHRNGGVHQLKNDDGKILSMTVEKAMELLNGKSGSKPKPTKPAATKSTPSKTPGAPNHDRTNRN